MHTGLVTNPIVHIHGTYLAVPGAISRARVGVEWMLLGLFMAEG